MKIVQKIKIPQKIIKLKYLHIFQKNSKLLIFEIVGIRFLNKSLYTTPFPNGGTDRQTLTHRLTDIATYTVNWPRGQCSEKIISSLQDQCVLGLAVC